MKKGANAFLRRPELRGKELQGHQPVQLEVARLENHAHPALADLFQQLVMG